MQRQQLMALFPEATERAEAVHAAADGHGYTHGVSCLPAPACGPLCCDGFIFEILLCRNQMAFIRVKNKKISSYSVLTCKNPVAQDLLFYSQRMPMKCGERKTHCACLLRETRRYFLSEWLRMHHEACRMRLCR